MTHPADCDPTWPADHELLDPHLHDLRGQGLTEHDLHTITDIPLTGSYL